MNEWIFRFGAPRKIHLDCGKSFESKLMKEMAEKCGKNPYFSGPYHHSTNVIIEHQFRTIRDFINTSVNDGVKTGWNFYQSLNLL